MSNRKLFLQAVAWLFFAPVLFCSISLRAQLVIQKGITVSCTGNALVTLKDIDLVVSGGLSQAPGTAHFLFTGSGNNVIGGTNQPQFDIFEITKTGTAGIALQQGINISGAVQFTSGLIDLNSNTILLQPGALLSNEKENSRITGSNGGYIQATAVLNSPVAANPGNLGAIISSSQILGSTIVRRGHISQTNAAGGGSSLLRYYDISPAGNTALNASLQFNYFDAELNGIDENNLVLWKSAGDVNWVNTGYSARSAVDNYVTQTGIADFSRFTLSTFNNALPVLFSMQQVECLNGAAVIRWKTTQEENNSRFILQKSADGISWQDIGSVPGAGNSSIEKSYSYTYSFSQSGQTFYRIGSEDFNGRIQYNKAMLLNCDGNRQAVTVYPNPVSDLLWVAVTLPYPLLAKTTLTTTEGRIVHVQTNSLPAGSSGFSIATKNFAAGMYLLTVQKNDGTIFKSIKIIKY
ncbi:MAG: T9SS type A sorting domain-containing protein [Bacteroidota bacterium]